MITMNDYYNFMNQNRKGGKIVEDALTIFDIYRNFLKVKTMTDWDEEALELIEKMVQEMRESAKTKTRK